MGMANGIDVATRAAGVRATLGMAGTQHGRRGRPAICSGARIRDLLMALRVTAHEFAGYLGVTHSLVAGWSLVPPKSRPCVGSTYEIKLREALRLAVEAGLIPPDDATESD